MEEPSRAAVTKSCKSSCSRKVGTQGAEKSEDNSVGGQNPDLNDAQQGTLRGVQNAQSGGSVREAEIHARIAQILKDLNAKILRDGKPKALLRSPGSRQRAKDEITALGAELERITALGQVRSSPFRPRWADVADTDEVGDTTAGATATTHGRGRGATARRRARGQGR